jgi:hypothetical protein
MPPAKTAPKLSDLTAEEREQLARELHATEQAEKEKIGLRRAEQLHGELRERDHLDGCPIYSGEQSAVGRMEAYAATKPHNPRTGSPEKALTVVRCIQCGGSVVKEEAYDAFLERLDRQADGSASGSDEDTDEQL